MVLEPMSWRFGVNAIDFAKCACLSDCARVFERRKDRKVRGTLALTPTLSPRRG